MTKSAKEQKTNERCNKKTIFYNHLKLCQTCKIFSTFFDLPIYEPIFLRVSFFETIKILNQSFNLRVFLDFDLNFNDVCCHYLSSSSSEAKYENKKSDNNHWKLQSWKRVKRKYYSQIFKTLQTFISVWIWLINALFKPYHTIFSNYSNRFWTKNWLANY